MHIGYFECLFGQSLVKYKLLKIEPYHKDISVGYWQFSIKYVTIANVTSSHYRVRIYQLIT